MLPESCKSSLTTVSFLQQDLLGTPNTVPCRYDKVNFLKMLTIDTPYLAHEGEVWGIYCEFKVCPMFDLGQYIVLLWYI